MDLLLLSSSRTPAGYLTDYMADIRAITGNARRAAFIPYAAVRMPWDEYRDRVQQALGFLDISVAEAPIDVARAELLIVGGGNTFQLLRECRQRGMLAALREKVAQGVPYLGWSAGANLACPTIKTTNDMPIVDPGGLDALGLIPIQINPHYLSVSLPGHHGETRDDRLQEFAHANPKLPVIGLPEGDWLRVSGKRIELRGPHRAMWFEGERAPAPISAGALPPFFGDKA